MGNQERRQDIPSGVCSECRDHGGRHYHTCSQSRNNLIKAKLKGK